jgi:hypothetical protein
MSIGPGCYLEIIGPDPAQAPPVGPRWFGIDALSAPRLVAWAAAATDLPRLVNDAAERGVRLGAVGEGRRERPDGVVLEWRVTDPTVVLGDGLVPFFIDWGASPHPSSTAVVGPRLVALRGEHPDPGHVRTLLVALGVALPVDAAVRPSLVATLETNAGLVQLR